MQEPIEPDILHVDDEQDWTWTTQPERALWHAVLLKALDDLGHADPEIRQDAVEFIHGPHLDAVLELAGFDRGIAPRIRAHRPAPQVRPPRGGYALEYQGEVHTLQQWAKRLGINDWLIYRRHRKGLPIEQILAPELSRRGRKKRVPNISEC